ncbi:MAG: hypothetical protein SP1CHLAM54_08940 [Chlamydiia bacterium]|nr:hypothetical protein [Chlamydiia bacterium]MCH9615800.1 hypothetical protein [Chlamydiia bacterium]MCH9628797.1 hypothetical protein [Chlamydiia bacterium]
MKKTFLTGLIILSPIAITVLIIRFCLDILTEPFIGMFQDLLPSTSPKNGFLLLMSRLAIIIGLFFFTLLLGYLGRAFIVKWFLGKMDKLMNRIPLIKGIYSISREVASNFFQTDKKPFKGSIVLPFPHKDTKALGFLTGEVPAAVQSHSEEKLSSVFVPTAPHPVSGFVVMVADKEFYPADMTTEEVFKFLISCGLYEKEKEKDDQD